MKKILQLTILLILSQLTYGALSGTKIISASDGDFYTISDAIDALNSEGVGVNGVEFILNSDENYELQPDDNLAITVTGTNSDPVSFTTNSSSKATIIIPGNSVSKSNGFEINGGDYISFSNLILECSANIKNGFYITNSDVNKGANNISIENCEINLKKSPQDPTAGIIIDYSTDPSDSTSACKRNFFSDNTITSADVGIHIENNTLSDMTYDLDNQIKGNTISNFSKYGIFAKGQRNCVISANKLIDLLSENNEIDVNSEFAGICVSGYFNTIDILENEISDIQARGLNVCGIMTKEGIGMTTDLEYNINRNIISNIVNYGDSCLAGGTTRRAKAYGISVNATNSTNYIFNNVVYDITAPNSATMSAAGISITGLGSVNKMYYNTVRMSGMCLAKYSSYSCLSAGSLPDLIDSRNNIFVNMSEPKSAIAFVFDKIGGFDNISPNSNYNLYLANPDEYQSWIFFPSSFDPGLDYHDISIYQDAAETNGVKFDQNTISEVPNFKSTGEVFDLNLNSQLSSYAEPLADVSTDFNGNLRSESSPTIGAYEFSTEAIWEGANNIQTCVLNPCYPNPFNPETNISFNLAKKESINLYVYNCKGERVAEIYRGVLSGGNHTFKFRAIDFNSGVYFVRLQTQDLTKSQKIILVK